MRRRRKYCGLVLTSFFNIWETSWNLIKNWRLKLMRRNFASSRRLLSSHYALSRSAQEIHQAVDEENAKVKDSKALMTKFPVVLADKSDDERKLTWQLSPYDNKNFDKQGLGPNQGPFSRELPKKCMPPANWLRMKLRHRLHFTKTSHSTIRIR